MVRCLNDFVGGESLLPRGSRAADLEQASNLSHGETATAVQKKVAEQPGRIIILPDLLAESKGRLQDRALLDRQAFCGKTGLNEPWCKRTGRGRHRPTSWQLQVV